MDFLLYINVFQASQRAHPHVYIVFGLLDMNLTLPEPTLFMKQESHDWSLLNS